MKQLLRISLLLALATQTVAAKPWYKDWKAWTVITVSLGASAAATHYAHTCREHSDVAFCAGGYGPFAAREGLRLGGAVTFTSLSLWGRKEHYREWAVPALAFAAYNTTVAVRQSRIARGKE